MYSWGCDTLPVMLSNATAPARPCHDSQLYLSGYFKKELASYLLLASQNIMWAAVDVYHTYVKLLIDGFCPLIINPYLLGNVWYGVGQSSVYHTFGTCETFGPLIL